MKILIILSIIIIIPVMLNFVNCATVSGIKQDMKTAIYKIEQYSKENTKTNYSQNETIIIPEKIILRGDGKYVDYTTGEIIDSKTVVQMVYDYENWKLGERERQEELFKGSLYLKCRPFYNTLNDWLRGVKLCGQKQDIILYLGDARLLSPLELVSSQGAPLCL